MKRKMCKLNEELYGGVDVSTDRELDIVGAVPIDYADAVNLKRKKNKDLEKTYKELGKRQKEFIDKNHKREELSESLFEDANDVVEKKRVTIDDLAHAMAYTTGFKFDKCKLFIKRAVKGGNFNIRDYLKQLNTWYDAGSPDMTQRARAMNDKVSAAEDANNDLFYKVYDELAAASSDVPSQNYKAIKREFKVSPGTRYRNVTTTTDGEILVQAEGPDSFEFANKVAAHYGVEISEPQKYPEKATDPSQQWFVKIKIPANKLYQQK